MKEFLFGLLHYLIGFIIVIFLLWVIIKTHNYFSKNNLSIDTVLESTKASLYQVNEQQIKLINNEDNMAYIRFEKTKPFKTEILTSPSMTSNETKNNMTMPTCSMSSRTLPSQIADSGISNDTSISTFNSFSNFFFYF